MQTIISKYLGATNHKPNRIKATAKCGISVTRSVDDELLPLTDDERHARVVEQLCRELDWPGPMVGGHIKGGMVWVFSLGSPTTLDQSHANKVARDGKAVSK